jgi:hypothetical protein
MAVHVIGTGVRRQEGKIGKATYVLVVHLLRLTVTTDHEERKQTADLHQGEK